MKELPTYIVTGATGGIGKAITEALAAEGVRVVLAVRNPDKARSVVDRLSHTGARLEVMSLDLGSAQSVETFASEVISRGWPIKALINNAGVMPGHITVTGDGYESATQVNYVSTRRLTELLAPYVESGGAIVFTTSMTRKIVRCRRDWAEHAKTFRGIGRRFITYGRSKRMIAGYAASLGAELAPRRITVNCSDPGIADTSMVTMGNPVVDFLSAKLFRPFIHTPAQGAEAALRALRSQESGYIFTRKGKTKNKIKL